MLVLLPALLLEAEWDCERCHDFLCGGGNSPYCPSYNRKSVKLQTQNTLGINVSTTQAVSSKEVQNGTENEDDIMSI